MTELTEESFIPTLPVVHLCIATEQVLANVLPLRLLPWQQVIVIASDQMRQRSKARLDQFLRWAESEAHRRGLSAMQAVRLVALPDTGLDWGGLLAFARSLAAELNVAYQGQPMDINVTGGTKLMTQAFTTAFAGRARALYCNTQGESLEVLDPAGSTPAIHLPAHLMTLENHLFAQGFDILGRQTAQDIVWLQTIKARLPLTLALVRESQRLRRTPGYAKQRLLTLLHGCAASSLPSRREGRGYRSDYHCPAPHTPVWDIMVDLMQTYGVLEVLDWPHEKPNMPQSVLHGRWCSEEAAQYMAGGYLEEYAFLCAHALGLPPGHVACNVRLRLYNSHLPNGYDYQELDVVIVWRNRLWVLECKAGMQIHNGGGQDVLNKLDALKVRVGGALGEGWLLTPLPLHENVEQQLPVIERARNYGIRLVHGGGELGRFPGTLASALKCDGVAPTLGNVPRDLRVALEDAVKRVHGQYDKKPLVTHA